MAIQYILINGPLDGKSVSLDTENKTAQIIGVNVEDTVNNKIEATYIWNKDKTALIYKGSTYG